MPKFTLVCGFQVNIESDGYGKQLLDKCKEGALAQGMELYILSERKSIRT